MMSISSLFFKGAVLWFVAGTSVGMQMGLSGNHNFIDTHAHLNLLGWVSSALFGCFYALHPTVAAKRWAWVHFTIYNAGLVLMLPSLYLVQVGYEWAELLMQIGSTLTWAGVIFFAILVFTAPASGRNSAGD
jgi:cbb3-type cytochrome oxidase subunit 1